MYAIINVGGQQIKVEKGKSVFVNRMAADAGSEVKIDQVLMVDDNGSVDLGSPTVAGATVTVKILEHLKGDKILVFKKKRRKGYKKMNGHRQYLSKIEIADINFKSSKKK